MKRWFIIFSGMFAIATIASMFVLGCATRSSLESLQQERLLRVVENKDGPFTLRVRFPSRVDKGKKLVIETEIHNTSSHSQVVYALGLEIPYHFINNSNVPDGAGPPDVWVYGDESIRKRDDFVLLKPGCYYGQKWTMILIPPDVTGVAFYVNYRNKNSGRDVGLSPVPVPSIQEKPDLNPVPLEQDPTWQGDLRIEQQTIKIESSESIPTKRQK